MTTFTTGWPDNNDHKNPSQDEDGSPTKSNIKMSLLRDLFFHHTRIDLLKKSLIRIIGMIVIAAILVGLYEWLG